MEAPKNQACGPYSDDRPHALGLGVQIPMPKKAANISSRFLLLDIQMHQAVPHMAQAGAIKPRIECEQSRPMQLVKERNDLVVLHPRSAHIEANLPRDDTPTP